MDLSSNFFFKKSIFQIRKFSYFFCGLFLYKKNNEVEHPIGGGRCLAFYHKFLTINTSIRLQMTILYNIKATNSSLLFVVGISLNVTFNQVVRGLSPRRPTSIWNNLLQWHKVWQYICHTFVTVFPNNFSNISNLIQKVLKPEVLKV